MSSGLTKLIEAADQIKVMNEKLEVQQVAVKQKSEACDTLLEDITTKTELVTNNSYLFVYLFIYLFIYLFVAVFRLKRRRI